MEKAEKDKKIRKEQRRLERIFESMDENKLSVVRALIARAAFITVSLEELEQDLSEDGWIEEYKNGAAQSGLKKSAAADVHISLTKNLNAIIKQLLEVVPESQRESKLEKMMIR